MSTGGEPRPPGTTSREGARRSVLGAVAVAALGVVALVPHVSGSFFYADDYLNFGQARESGLTWGHLVAPIYEHFAPGHRLLSWAQLNLAGLSWTTAMAVFLTLYAGAVLAFWWLAAQLFGRTTSVLAVTFLFAMSIAFVRPMQWWSSGAHTLPSLFFGLLALALAIRYVATRSTLVALSAAVAYSAGLLFYTKGLLVFAYLVLILVLFLERDLRAAPVARRLWRERGLLLAFAVPTAGYLAYYFSGPYGAHGAAATPAQLADYLRILWLWGFGPTLVGQRVSPGAARHLDGAVVGAQLLVLAAVAGSLLLKRSAWRAWSFFAVAGVAAVLPVGVTRIAQFGPGVGYDARYWIELPMLFALSLGFALYRGDVAGRPLRRDEQARGERLRRRLPHGRRLAAAAAALAAAYVVSHSVGAGRIADEWPAGEARTYVENVRQTVYELGGRGRPASPVGGPVPFHVVAGILPPASEQSWVVPLIDERITVGDARRRIVVLGEDGRATPARWSELRGGPAGDLLDAELLTGVGGRVDRSGDSVCLEGGPEPALLELAASVGAAAEGVAALRAYGGRGATGGEYGVLIDRGGGYPGAPERTIGLEQGSQSLTEVGSGPVTRLAIVVPPGERACVARLAVGTFAAATRR